MKHNYTNIFIAAVLVLIATSTRIMNQQMHLWNFAPLVAIGLFSGSVIKDRRMAFLVPLLGQFVADVYFQLFTNTPGFYGVSQIFTYAGLLGAAYLGMLMAKPKAINVLVYTFSASTLFFIVSNLGVWLEGSIYSKNFAGLINCYVSAVPFFKNAIAGDMLGSVLFFGTYFLVQSALSSKIQKAV